MKEKLQHFTFIFILGMFILGIIILKSGLENSNTIFSILGLIIIVSILLIVGIYLFSGNLKQRKINNEFQRNLTDFKSRAQKITVNLEQIEIKRNSWTDEVVKNEYSKYAVVDHFAGNHDANIIKVDRNLNSVKILIPIDNNNNNNNNNNNKLEYIVNIEMDPTVLSMHFAIQKETLFYFDDEQHYLDLEFLE